MSRAPELAASLRSHGFHVAARSLDAAADATAEILALRFALATVDGAQHVLRCYARSLRSTRAATDRAALRLLEDALCVRVGALFRETRALARNVQEGGS